MSYARFSARVIATLLAATSLLSVTALAAPAGGTTTAIRVNQAETISAADAAGSIQSGVTVSADQATNSYEVIYQDANGSETSATVTGMNPNQTIYGYVSANGDGLRVRQGPGTSYPILATVTDGSAFPITGKTDGWYQIAYNGKTGYVSSDYLVQDKPGSKPSVDTSRPSGDIAPPSSFDGELAQRIVNYALQFEGFPYVYATAGPNSFDCSGLTYYVYKQFGYTLNRSSKDLIYDGVHVEKSELQPSDLVLFSSNGTRVTHVGIYIGDGMFIHASTPTKGVIISDLYSNYYVNCYYDSRRII